MTRPIMIGGSSFGIRGHALPGERSTFDGTDRCLTAIDPATQKALQNYGTLELFDARCATDATARPFGWGGPGYRVARHRDAGFEDEFLA